MQNIDPATQQQNENSFDGKKKKSINSIATVSFSHLGGQKKKGG